MEPGQEVEQVVLGQAKNRESFLRNSPVPLLPVQNGALQIVPNRRDKWYSTS